MYMGGNVLYANKQARPWGYWFYSGASIRLPIFKTRLTLGGSNGSEEIFGFRRFNRSDGSQLKEPIRPLSLMLGLEQPITKNLTFIIDYFGGEHELGATMPGVQYKRGHNLFIVGYKIPNYERLASDALILEVMIGAQLWKQKNSFEGDAGQ